MTETKNLLEALVKELGGEVEDTGSDSFLYQKNDVLLEVPYEIAAGSEVHVNLTMTVEYPQPWSVESTISDLKKKHSRLPSQIQSKGKFGQGDNLVFEYSYALPATSLEEVSEIVEAFCTPLTLKKVLVVEDLATHRADAEEYLTSQGVEVVFAENYEQAHRLLERAGRNQIDAVITDLFFPYGQHRFEREGDNPLGVLVAAEAKKEGLPVAVCTAGYHHGAKYQWVHQLSRAGACPGLIDGNVSGNDEADHKNWDQAYDLLKQQFE